MKRLPPSARLKEEITGLLRGTEPIASPEEPPMVGFVGRLARYMLQVAIEAEATAFLGREHYRRVVRVTALKERLLAHNTQINWVPDHIHTGLDGLADSSCRDLAKSI